MLGVRQDFFILQTAQVTAGVQAGVQVWVETVTLESWNPGLGLMMFTHMMLQTPNEAMFFKPTWLWGGGAAPPLRFKPGLA